MTSDHIQPCGCKDCSIARAPWWLRVALAFLYVVAIIALGVVAILRTFGSSR